MDVINIYQDYEAWRKENYDFIKELLKIRSKTVVRFSPVLIVVDYLYELSKKKRLNPDELIFFRTGFDYIYDNFHYINTLYSIKYNNDINELEKYSKSINLLLYLNEFKQECKEHKEVTENDVKKLTDIEAKILEKLDNKENIDDEYFQLLNDVIDSIFEAKGIEVHTIDEIYNEIAVEYNLIAEDDYNIYNEIINKEIEKKRKAN